MEKNFNIRFCIIHNNKFLIYFHSIAGCFEEDTQLLGNDRDLPGDLKGIRSAKECQEECQLHPSCKEFNYHEIEPHECLLKYEKMAKFKYSNGCDSCKDWTYGPRYCDEGINFTDHMKGKV